MVTAMLSASPLVHAALISGAVAIVTAFITRPARNVNRRVRNIEYEFRNNNGSSAKDQLDRIESGLSHLLGRFDQHIEEHRDR